jgi:hypothetical protein
VCVCVCVCVSESGRDRKERKLRKNNLRKQIDGMHFLTSIVLETTGEVSFTAGSHGQVGTIEMSVWILQDMVCSFQLNSERISAGLIVMEAAILTGSTMRCEGDSKSDREKIRV